MSAPVLDRLVFTTSRLAEFCSKRELINQTGHDSEDWPLVILKELIDNSLDACEEAGVAPVIDVEVSDDGIAVTDNGPGIAPDTVANILDYTSRTSSREAYCSPTRGAQGNGLKTLLAMPFALDGARGETTIESQGAAHRVTFSIDPIRQEPRSPGRMRCGTRWTTSHERARASREPPAMRIVRISPRWASLHIDRRAHKGKLYALPRY